MAADLGGLIGWHPGDGVPSLTAAMAAWVPAGSTAKVEAIAAGEIPPGDDADAIARRLVGDRGAGRAELAWSCWALTTLMAGMLEASGTATATVAATRQIGPRAATVDLHSAVVADDGEATWICDPYFAVTLPGPGADDVEVLSRGVMAMRSEGADGRWGYYLGGGRWARRLTYRLLAPRLDADDVRAMCAISATHSGVPPGRSGHLWSPEVVTDVRAPPDGGARMRQWRWAGPDRVWDGDRTVTPVADWAEATEAFAETTGVRLA